MTPLCRLDDIADPGARGFALGDEFRGFVVRSGGTVRGYVDSCPHTGAPLALTPTGYLTGEGDLIVCSTHGALFRIEDGLCIAGPCAGQRLNPWPIEVHEGEVAAR